MALTTEQIQERLSSARNIWLASVRANGAPHLVPIWFVAHQDRIYVCTPPDSVKVGNLRRNPRIALALEDGSVPVILEGTAAIMDNLSAPAAVLPMFKAKYGWEILVSEPHYVMIEVTPSKTLSWNSG